MGSCDCTEGAGRPRRRRKGSSRAAAQKEGSSCAVTEFCGAYFYIPGPLSLTKYVIQFCVCGCRCSSPRDSFLLCTYMEHRKYFDTERPTCVHSSRCLIFFPFSLLCSPLERCLLHYSLSLATAAPLARAHAPPLGSLVPRPPRLLVSALSTPRRPASYPSFSPSIPPPQCPPRASMPPEWGATAATSKEESTPPSLPALSPSLSHLHTSRDNDDSMASTKDRWRRI